ncbi:MAG: hypothetical protein R2865_01080 [Deinococcales bacterium]
MKFLKDVSKPKAHSAKYWLKLVSLSLMLAFGLGFLASCTQTPEQPEGEGVTQDFCQRKLTISSL